MKKLFYLLLFSGALAFGQGNPDGAFDVPADRGFGFATSTGQIIHMSAGSANPAFQAPIGSVYFQTDTTEWKKVGPLAVDWEIRGVGSSVVTQTASFGETGNIPVNTFVKRVGGVPSNIVGVPILVNGGSIRVASVFNENVSTYNVEFYQHDGNFTNPVLVYTLVVTNDYGVTVSNLNVTVTKEKQLAAKITGGAVKNVGVTIAMKGLSL